MILTIIAAVIALLILTIFVTIRLPKFGKKPSGNRLERITKSVNYKNGAFQNQSITPDLTEGATMLSVMNEFFFKPNPRAKPAEKIPSVKTDLFKFGKNEDVLVWFGHSSYFMQVDGKKILVDPVLSGHASPFAFTTRAFDGADIYKPADIPEIDFLFISHDHWDHLDYNALMNLKPKIKKIICGLGTAEHLERWGFSPGLIIEKDWNETVSLDNGFIVHTVPSRHFSGRGLKRNQAIWTSFVLQTPTMNLFLGGDSGYDRHFAEAGQKYGPFDLAILENGQYNKSWKFIHMMPGEVLQAARDLKAKRLLAVHNSKFKLGNHPWDEPMINITELNKVNEVNLITPMIGEVVYLKQQGQVFTQWWKPIE